MTTFKGKAIYEMTIADGNRCRQEYVDSVNNFVEKKLTESFDERDTFMRDIVCKQEAYRQQFLEMIGSPVTPYPSDVPNAKTEFVGKDDFCEIYRLQIETMPGFWFYGILMVPHGVHKAPLVIAQHGGGSAPEICSDFLGVSNYSFFTKRALEKGMVVFAPQLLLWKFDINNGEPKNIIDISYSRAEMDKKLKQVGLSITGLEIFCIRRSIDYLQLLEYIDKERIAMMGASYGGYFSLCTAAADTRIKSIYAAAFFNDRTKIAFDSWTYKNSATRFGDAEIAALCAPRRLQLDVGKSDAVFDYAPAVKEGERATEYYSRFNAADNFCFNLWDGGHSFDVNEKGFEFFFDAI